MEKEVKDAVRKAGHILRGTIRVIVKVMVQLKCPTSSPVAILRLFYALLVATLHFLYAFLVQPL